MRMRPLVSPIVTLALIAVAAAPSWGQVDGYTKPKMDIPLGFVTPGQIAAVNVQAFQYVSKDTVLMSLDKTVREAVVQLYRVRSENDVPERAAKERLKLSQIELKRVEQAVKDGVANQLELQRAQVQVEVDKLAVEQATRQAMEAAAELAREEALLRQYDVKAPMAGIVQKLTSKVPFPGVGQVVEQQTPLFRLLVIDPLIVDADVPTKRSEALQIGGDAWVWNVPQEGSDEEMTATKGKIVAKSSLADAGSRTLPVTIEIPNPDKQAAGKQVIVTFTPDKPRIRSTVRAR